MNYFIYILLALLPSLIWLLFFLRKDTHPESNRMILKIFFYGMMAALPAALIEMGIFELFGKLNLNPFLISCLNIFVGVALIEELLKYLVVRGKVISNPEFDEPLDIMLYMIIAALGFVALENILIFLSPKVFLLPIGETLGLAGFRFISATFLHALCSGTIGFFLALSFFESENKSKLLALGLGIAALLHGIYNFSIMETEGNAQFIIPIIILIGLALFVSFGFKKVKKMRSVCEVN